MTELDKITLKMALFALILGLVGCAVGWLGGSIHTEKELNKYLKNHCVVECGECGGINRVIPPSCLGKVKMVEME